QNMNAGGHMPEPEAAFSSSKPTAQNPGQPQGQGAPEGPAGGGEQAAAQPSPTGGAPTPTPTPEATPSSKPAAESQATTETATTANAGKGPAGMPAELWKGCVEAAEKTGADPFVLAAQMEKESQFGKALAGGSPSAADGLMQVEPTTRDAYAAKFEAKMGHAYDHANQKDQIAMAGVILADKGGDTKNMLQKYNGGDNWVPGTTDSYGREIKAQEYAATVMARAEAMKGSAG
ncbi:MAG: transglycosylase SLT domain-containing protein, partial [Rhizobacter sp.]